MALATNGSGGIGTRERVVSTHVDSRIRSCDKTPSDVCMCGGVYTVDGVPIDLSTRFLDSYSTYILYTREADRPSQSRLRNRCCTSGEHGHVSSHRYMRNFQT